MGSIDLARLEQRARVGYEWGRLRHAVLGVVPIVGIVAIASLLTHRPDSTLAFGVATVAASLAMLWYGREPLRAVLPGVAAGFVPLALALGANFFHACGADGCTSLCVPACTLGGVVAGLGVASVGHQRRAGVGFWLSASGIALLTGSMGCACVGAAGIIGLGVGFAAGMVPGVLRVAFGGKHA